MGTGMKTTRKRYSADFKAKVALEAIRGDLTLAELAAKHGVHHTMIAAWKRQATEGMANTFSGAGDAAKAVSESEVEKLHAKIGQLVVERDLYEGLSVKGRTDLQQRSPMDRLTQDMKLSGDDHHRAVVRLAHQLISGSSMTACHNPTCTAQTVEGTVSYFLPVQ